MTRGFTLIELLAVMVVVSILAATAAPVLSRVADARRGVLAGEVERTLALARSRALSSGVPAGVAFDVDDQTVRPLELPDGGTPRAFMETYDIRQRAAGAALTAVAIPGGATALWFAPDATPHTRGDTGAFLANLTQGATFTVEGGLRVTVEPNSGRIHR